MLHSNGGQIEQLKNNQSSLFVILSLSYFSIFLFNLTDQIIKHQSIIERSHFTLPFLLLAFLFMTKYKFKINLIIDICLFSIMTIQAKIGDFSGVPFLFLILFKISKKNHFYFMMLILFISVGMGSIVNKFSRAQIFVMVSLYIFMGIKYYYDIYLVLKHLKEKLSELLTENKTMEEEIIHLKSMIKASLKKPMTDDEILETYPFMIYSGNNPYRKIEALRLLAKQYGYKQIGGINGISENSQSREFNTMKEKFSNALNRKIITIQGLIIAGIELGIIQVEIIHP